MNSDTNPVSNHAISQFHLINYGMIPFVNMTTPNGQGQVPNFYIIILTKTAMSSHYRELMYFLISGFATVETDMGLESCFTFWRPNTWLQAHLNIVLQLAPGLVYYLCVGLRESFLQRTKPLMPPSLSQIHH